jgi:hypothetical protein
VGASLVNWITLRFFGAGWFLEGLSKVGETLEGTSLNGGYIIVTNEACWFLERLFVIGDFTGVVVVITAFDYKDLNYTLVLRVVIL